MPENYPAGIVTTDINKQLNEIGSPQLIGTPTSKILHVRRDISMLENNMFMLQS